MSELQSWKLGNEFLPFHPQASHVPPEYRDGWNRCYAAATAAALNRFLIQNAETGNREREIAEIECNEIHASSQYFDARSPLLDSRSNRNIFEAGFKAAVRQGSNLLKAVTDGAELQRVSALLAGPDVVREALANLVAAIDRLSPDLNNLIVLAANRGQNWSADANWTMELNAARAILEYSE